MKCLCQQESITLDSDEFLERFRELHNIHLNRFHKRLDAAKVVASNFPKDEQYWLGWNAALDWAHRIVDGDKSAD